MKPFLFLFYVKLCRCAITCETLVKGYLIKEPLPFIFKIFLAIIFCVTLLYLASQLGGVGMNGPNLGCNPLLYLITGLLGFVFVYSISSLYNKSLIFIEIISQNTLFIIFFHWVLVAFIGKMEILEYLSSEVTPFMQLVSISLMSLMVLLFCMPVVAFLKTYCPIMLGKYIYEK